MLGLGLGLTLPFTFNSSGGPMLFGRSFVFAGDSITANGGVDGTTLATHATSGYWTWAMSDLRGKMRPCYKANAGVSGNTSAQLRARFATDVTAKNPNCCVIHIGTNNVTAVTDAGTATTQTNNVLGDLAAMAAALRANGCQRIYIYEIFPRGSVGSPMNAFQITAWEAIRNGIRAMAASDLRPINCEPDLGNGDAAHTIKVGHTISGDNLHPNELGAYEASKALTAAVTADIVAGDMLFTTNNAAGNFIGNGFMTGSGGILSGGATGAAPTSWVLEAGLAGGATIAGSVVARGDGYGQWAQIAISGTYTGDNTGAVLYRQYTSSVLSGRRVQGRCEFEVDTTHSRLVSIEMRNVIGSYSTYSMSPLSAENTERPGAYTGVIQTPIMQMGANETAFAHYLRANLMDGGLATACAATVRFGRVEFVDVA